MDFYRLYQLPASSDRLFMGYREGAVDIRDYCCVWANDDADFRGDDLDICEDLFAKFNANLPKGFGGHSMSVSDIVEIHVDGKMRFYYCDRFGFKLIEEK